MHLTNKDKMGNIQSNKGKKQNMFKNTGSWLQKLANAGIAQNLLVDVVDCLCNVHFIWDILLIFNPSSYKELITSS